MIYEAAKLFFNYALSPQNPEGDRPQVVAERDGRFSCIKNDADKCLLFYQIFLEPSHLVDFPVKIGAIRPLMFNHFGLF